MARRVLVIALAVILGGVLGVGAVRLVRSDSQPFSQPFRSGGEAAEGLLSPAGTPLPFDLQVLDGSALIGTIIPRADSIAVSYNARPLAMNTQTWFALILVQDDPRRVWQAYLEQLATVAAVQPDDFAASFAGCRDDGPRGYRCSGTIEQYVGHQPNVISAHLEAVPGDVTGAYLLQLTGATVVALPDPRDVGFPFGVYQPNALAWGPSAGNDPTTAPMATAATPPVAGEPIDPGLSAPLRDIVAVPGGRLVARFGSPQLAETLFLLVRVDPGGDLGVLRDGYVDQLRALLGTEPVGQELPAPVVGDREVIIFPGTADRTYARVTSIADVADGLVLVEAWRV